MTKGRNSFSILDFNSTLPIIDFYEGKVNPPLESCLNSLLLGEKKGEVNSLYLCRRFSRTGLIPLLKSAESSGAFLFLNRAKTVYKPQPGCTCRPPHFGLRISSSP